jgi:DNA primase
VGSVSTTRPGAERYGVRKPIETLKAEIPIEEYAGTFTNLRPAGKELRGVCPIHDGADNAYSFSVDPDQQLFHCFACGEGGDLIDLCEILERHADTWTAVLSLAERFDVKLPEKSDAWREWADEKDRRREMLTRIRTRHYQRRLLRLFQPELDGIADPEERKREAKRIYHDLYHLALRCAKQREVA